MKKSEKSEIPVSVVRNEDPIFEVYYVASSDEVQFYRVLYWVITCGRREGQASDDLTPLVWTTGLTYSADAGLDSSEDCSNYMGYWNCDRDSLALDTPKVRERFKREIERIREDYAARVAKGTVQ